MLIWRIAWREMRQHPGRALLTWLSVVIGVAAVLAVGMSTAAARRAYRDMFQAMTGRTALELTGVGGSPLEMSSLDLVRQTPGVQAAVPLIQRNTILYYGRGRMKLTALGIDVSRDKAVRDYQLVAGDRLSPRGGILLDESLAESIDVGVGDRVKLLVRRGLARTRVVGLVRPRSGADVASGGVLFMPLAVAQHRFALAGKCDRIQLVAQDDANIAELQAQLQSQLPAGVQLERPHTWTSLADETMRALESGLHLAIAFSLLAAMFIIMNTFSMSIGQRRRPLAMMRAIGATRRQIAALIFGEAILLGVLGTAAGFAVGIVGARVLNQAMSGMFQTPLPPIRLPLLPGCLAVMFGLGVSSLGACLPARRATQITPVEGMSGLEREDSENHVWLELMLGLGGTLLSVALLVACFKGWLLLEYSVIIVVTLLVSLVLLLPLVLKPFTRCGQWLLQPFIRIEARLARRQLLRHSGRTTLTIGVLFVAVATGLGLANSVVDNVEDVRRWYRTTVLGDFFLHAATPDLKTGLTTAVPDTVGDELQQIPGVAGVRSLRFVGAMAGEQRVIVLAIRRVFGVDPYANAPPTEGSTPAAVAGAPPNSVIIGSVLAQRMGLKAGDQITLAAQDGPQSLPIAAIKNDYSAGGLIVRMDRGLADRLFGVEGVDAYIIKSDPAELSGVEKSLRSMGAKHGLLLRSYAEMTQMIEGRMAGVVGSLWGLLVLGLIVAAFGVANTLGMNVLEQTRELGLLRVVAMTPGQVRKTIMAQAVMLGVLGVVPGLLAGVTLAYVMNLTMLPVIGHPVQFLLHPWLLAGCFAAAMTIVLLAAWVPAERAARLRPAAALRYE